MEIHEQKQGAVTVVRPAGPLCGADAERFKGRCVELMEASFGRVVVDASGVPYADSRGLEVLAELSERLSEAGQALKLCAATETVRESLDVTDLSAALEHYEDVLTAVRSFL